ncbi:MAG: carboxypeptidase-like regulatory domain-containing protein [Candidatus Freyarchaeota archaeon]
METGGPLFIMFSTLTKLTRTSGEYDAPNEAGYANVTYRFFKWGWITETQTNITYNFEFGVEYNLPGGWKRILASGEYVGNNYRFNPQLTTLTYKYGAKTTEDPYTSVTPDSLGEPYWFALYSTSNGQLAGVVDLMLPTLNGSENRNWEYEVKSISFTPEEWWRAWAVNLTIGDYVNEEYAFYVGGSLSSFEAFADGISFLGRESAPLVTTTVDEEYVHYIVYVNVTDYDGAWLANANVTVYNGSNYVGSNVTNSSGKVRFYLEPGDYNFYATWNGTTSYETYSNSTSRTIDSNNMTVDLVFYEITTLMCQTKYDNGQPIQNAYINLTNHSTGELVDFSYVNLTGWAEFNIKRSSVSGNYSIVAFYDDGTQFATSYQNRSIDSYEELVFEEPLGSKTYTYITFNGTTSFNVTWGTGVCLEIRWRDDSGNDLNTTAIGGSLNWTLYYINATPAYGPETLTPQGQDGDVYYLANVPSSLLFGGVNYQIYINASAPSTNYLPAANQTVVFVQPAAFNVSVTSLSGTYYWKHSNIPL